MEFKIQFYTFTFEKNLILISSTLSEFERFANEMSLSGEEIRSAETTGTMKRINIEGWGDWRAKNDKLACDAWIFQ